MADWAVPIATKPLIMKTGLWRSKRPEIDPAKCRKCGACFLHCPTGSVFLEASHYATNYDYCKGCGICVEVCRARARKMVTEEAAER